MILEDSDKNALSKVILEDLELNMSLSKDNFQTRIKNFQEQFTDSLTSCKKPNISGTLPKFMTKTKKNDK